MIGAALHLVVVCFHVTLGFDTAAYGSLTNLEVYTCIL